MKKLIVAITAALMLAACVKMGGAPPKDLPAYVKIYPGATQVMALNMGELSSIALQTTAKPDDIIAFYRTQAAADGLPEQAAPAPANATPGQKQAAFGDPSGGKMLIVVVKPQSDGSILSLTYKPAPKPAS